jgi:predicted amidophosphoribosyltransferase
VAAEASSAAPPAQEEAGAEGALAVAAAGEVAAAVIDDAGEAEKLCAACGSKVDPEDRFCRTCGLPLPQ